MFSKYVQIKVNNYGQMRVKGNIQKGCMRLNKGNIKLHMTK